MVDIVRRRNLFEIDGRLSNLRFVNGFTTDFGSSYPTAFRIGSSSLARSLIGYVHGSVGVTCIRGTDPVFYPIPLLDTRTITVTAGVSFELDVLKLDNDVWKVYQGWWWLSSGTSVDVSAYSGQGYYFIVLVQNSSASSDNVTIALE